MNEDILLLLLNEILWHGKSIYKLNLVDHHAWADIGLLKRAPNHSKPQWLWWEWKPEKPNALFLCWFVFAIFASLKKGHLLFRLNVSFSIEVTVHRKCKSMNNIWNKFQKVHKKLLSQSYFVFNWHCYSECICTFKINISFSN